MPPENFSEVIDIFLNLIGLAVPVIFALAVLVFLWGLAKFIMRVGGDETAIKEGKNLMIWGVVGIFMMMSVWGIISFFHNDIGFGEIGVPLLPSGEN